MLVGGLPFLLTNDPSRGPKVSEFASSDGNDSIKGGAGNDWLVGGTGMDYLSGGTGDDLIDADNDVTTDSGLNRVDDPDPSYADVLIGGGGATCHHQQRGDRVNGATTQDSTRPGFQAGAPREVQGPIGWSTRGSARRSWREPQSRVRQAGDAAQRRRPEGQGQAEGQGEEEDSDGQAAQGREEEGGRQETGGGEEEGSSQAKGGSQEESNEEVEEMRLRRLVGGSLAAFVVMAVYRRSRARSTSTIRRRNGCRGPMARSGRTRGPTAPTRRSRAPALRPAQRDDRDFRLGWNEVGVPADQEPIAGWLDFRASDPGLLNVNYQSTPAPQRFPLLCPTVVLCGNSLSGSLFLTIWGHGRP